MDVAAFLLLGLAAGWLASRVVKGGFGVTADLIVGVIGASLGGQAFRFFGVEPPGGFASRLAVAAIGAVILLSLLRLIKRA